MRHSVPWILVAVLAVTVAGLAFQLDQVTQRFARLAVETQNTNAALKSSQRRISELGAKLAQQLPKRPPSDDAKKSDDAPIVIHMRDVIRDHPEMAALWQKDSRRRVIERYGEAIAALHLPASQVEKLKQLLTEKELSPQDARDAAARAGVKSDSQEMRDAVELAGKQVDDEITALVGSAGYAQLKESAGVANYAWQVKNYTYDLADGGMPITAEQSQNLAKIVYNLAENSPHNAQSREVDPMTGLSPMDQQALDQAASFLSPEQVSLIKASRIQDNQKQAIMKLYYKKSNAGIITITD